MTTTFAALLLLQSPGNSVLGPVFMYGAIFAIFYFILIRPQAKQKKEHDALIRAVKKGDEVVTAGGVIGEVIHIKETPQADGGSAATSLEDRITIKSGDSRLLIERGKIARIIRRDTQPAVQG